MPSHDEGPITGPGFEAVMRLGARVLTDVSIRIRQSEATMGDIFRLPTIEVGHVVVMDRALVVVRIFKEPLDFAKRPKQNLA